MKWKCISDVYTYIYINNRIFNVSLYLHQLFLTSLLLPAPSKCRRKLSATKNLWQEGGTPSTKCERCIRILTRKICKLCCNKNSYSRRGLRFSFPTFCCFFFFFCATHCWQFFTQTHTHYTASCIFYLENINFMKQ